MRRARPPPAAAASRLEQEAGKLLGFDPVDGPNGSTNQVAQALANQSEQNLLHMVSADPNRTPNFILFANPDYYLFASHAAYCNSSDHSDYKSCFVEAPGFAWNHGDYQEPDHPDLARHGRAGRHEGGAARLGVERSHRDPSDDAPPRRADRRLRA